jgi:hypothetical protein
MFYFLISIIPEHLFAVKRYFPNARPTGRILTFVMPTCV